eukprot:jgi/Psemu1/55421/gm1.55421_g
MENANSNGADASAKTDPTSNLNLREPSLLPHNPHRGSEVTQPGTGATTLFPAPPSQSNLSQCSALESGQESNGRIQQEREMIYRGPPFIVVFLCLFTGFLFLSLVPVETCGQGCRSIASFAPASLIALIAIVKEVRLSICCQNKVPHDSNTLEIVVEPGASDQNDATNGGSCTKNLCSIALSLCIVLLAGGLFVAAIQQEWISFLPFAATLAAMVAALIAVLWFARNKNTPVRTENCCWKLRAFAVSLLLFCIGTSIASLLIDRYGLYNNWSTSIFIILIEAAIVFMARTIRMCKENPDKVSLVYSLDLALVVMLILPLMGYAMRIDSRNDDLILDLQIYGCVSLLILLILWAVNVWINNENLDDKIPRDPSRTLFTFMILSVVFPEMRTIGEVDNPDSDAADVDWFAGFIPANVTNLVRTTQIVSILSYVVFADASLLDISKAVEMFPSLFQSSIRDDNYNSGFLAIFAVFLLIMTSSEVTEIILNFTAVSNGSEVAFISNLDECAFTLAKAGKYGSMLEAAAKRIENEPLPTIMRRKHRHVRYRLCISVISAILFGLICFVSSSQESSRRWTTTMLRAQFEGYMFLAANQPDAQLENKARFGYCKADRRWVLFEEGNEKNLDPCDVGSREIAHSTKTDKFDISTSLDEAWYSTRNAPLDISFSELGQHQHKCLDFGNGICDHDLNKAALKYDEGDCCAATCLHKSGCGNLSSTLFFGVRIDSVYGFPSCKDPDMAQQAIQIRS